MVTRCNIIIKGMQFNKKTSIMLYRHWDGKPSVTGKELLNKLKDYISTNVDSKICFDSLVNNLLKSRDGKYEYSSQMHMDIEWLYTIDLTKNKIYVQSVDMDWSTGIIKLGEKTLLEKILG